MEDNTLRCRDSTEVHVAFMRCSMQPGPLVGLLSWLTYWVDSIPDQPRAALPAPWPGASTVLCMQHRRGCLGEAGSAQHWWLEWLRAEM